MRWVRPIIIVLLDGYRPCLLPDGKKNWSGLRATKLFMGREANKELGNVHLKLYPDMVQVAQIA